MQGDAMKLTAATARAPPIHTSFTSSVLAKCLPRAGTMLDAGALRMSTQLRSLPAVGKLKGGLWSQAGLGLSPSSATSWCVSLDQVFRSEPQFPPLYRDGKKVCLIAVRVR